MKEDKIKNLINLYFNSTRLIRQRISSSGDPLDHVSWLQLHSLSFVEENLPTASELGTFLNISRPSATSLINNLVRHKYIKKIKEKDDARSSRLVILSAGRKFLKDGQAKMVANMRPILSELSEDELENFITIYKRLQEICRNNGAHTLKRPE